MEWGEQFPLLCHGIHTPPGSFTDNPSKPFRCSLLRAYLSPTAPDRREGYLLSTTHSVLWYQNLESNQTLKVYETSMRIGASGIKRRLVLCTYLPQKGMHETATPLRLGPHHCPTLYLLQVAVKSGCLVPRPTGYRFTVRHRLPHWRPREMGSGCSRAIRTPSSGYEPDELPLLHHCDTVGVSSTPELYPNFLLSLA